MNINVDISFFPDHLIPIITNSVEVKPFYVKNYHVNNQDITAIFSVFEFPGSMRV